MIGTYAELKAAIADWLERRDLDDQIPAFIQNAEARLNKRVRHREMEANAALTLDANGWAQLPDDFVEARSLIVATTPESRPRMVEPWSAEFQHAFRPYAPPQYFAVLVDRLRVQPATEATADLYYYAKIPALTDANTTNWLLERSPEAYLYAALVEGAMFTVDKEAAEGYAALLTDAVNELKVDGFASRMTRTGAAE